jgi:streptogramin lyase
VFNESGQFLFSFGRKGSLRDRGSLSSPTAIAIDSEDYVYISESNVGVSIFDSNGNFMKAFSVCEKSLGNVKAMHIDTRGNLYVCESRNNCVCTFSGNKTQQN